MQGILIAAALAALLSVICLIMLIITNSKLTALKNDNNSSELSARVEQIKSSVETAERIQREELNRTTRDTMLSLGESMASRLSLAMEAQGESTEKLLQTVTKAQQSQSDLQTEKLEIIDKNMMKQLDKQRDEFYEQLTQFSKRIAELKNETSESMEKIRKEVETKLYTIQQDNNKKLDEMRGIVDEKLQDTLNKRMTESFKQVSERLEQVYKGLGEMQTLAQGVGDLKKVLSNVKTRGIVGEIQLGAILEEILSPEQYQTNIATKPGSKNVVEYAVKLPTEKGGFIYLPIDAKFPGDSYSALCDAYESGIPEEVERCRKQLYNTIRLEAKDVRDKYISPPDTTDFAIMFLPFEGLYAEVVNHGMVEELQKMNINIAGPSTMAALLNSLQMSFRTIAIQKRSGEVWQVLEAVKTEFNKFADTLKKTQERLKQADDELEKLVGTRTRQIQKRLKGLSETSSEAARSIIGSVYENDYEYVEADDPDFDEQGLLPGYRD